MRLGRSVLENAMGLDIFAIIGILLFFTFFIVVLIRVVRMKKTTVDEYSRLPLEMDEDDVATMENNESETENTK
jgi:cytochrome c oxidase cbb3-type subunit IV